MSDWKTTYDGVFFISIATILTAFFGVVFKYCLKSKCEDMNFCFGLLHIKRRVDLEANVELREIELNSHFDETETTSNVKQKRPSISKKTLDNEEDNV